MFVYNKSDMYIHEEKLENIAAMYNNLDVGGFDGFSSDVKMCISVGFPPEATYDDIKDCLLYTSDAADE